ncbi:MAG: gamma-glutamyltransferase [Acidobacteria bacterium]|uniref:Glutathione hydrolase proenzyme n=1 Tax=Candidatus Polarisedimenticola svalbardensis TaxID=2886004 RepID=A0A8J7CFD8_9BACT|nr:gamma-glutamyltransferase [Candidatus Polarisedimenticola svalbardensis]
MRTRGTILLLALMLTVPMVAGDRDEGSMFATRSVVHARNGMVAASHPLAVQIGLDVLKDGGTAVDAAIAVNAALGFLEPVACGIGGDLFALVWDAESEKLYGLNGSGRSPLALTADMVPPEPDGTIPVYSPYAWSVPGTVDGWFELHGRFGKLPMARILAPAIQAAEEGEPVPQVIAAAWGRSARVFGDKPGFASTFLPGGKAPKAGEIFRNPGLARSYRLLAEKGRDAFYKGEIGRAVVAFSEKHGGFFSMKDFTSHRSEWVEPVSAGYRGATLWELPPNGQGIAALEMVNILKHFDLAAMGRGSAEFWHTLIEAKKLAYEDRARYYADPDFADVPVEGLVSESYGRTQAKRLGDRAARTLAAGEPGLSRGDTTYFAVADRFGNMVSLIQSNYTGFGSGYVVEGYGFGLQDRGALFNLKPGTANFLEPGKRPFHTIIPAFITREGKPWIAFGVMGGDMQPQGHVQVLVNLVDFGMNLQEAGDAPRFYHTGSSEPTGTTMTTGGMLSLESGISDLVRRDLVKKGHRLVHTLGRYGGYQAVALDPVTGVLSGASESRKDGHAAGY